MNQRLKYGTLFLIWYPLRKLLRALTLQRGNYRRLLTIGDLLGDLFYFLFPIGRQILRRELANFSLYEPSHVRQTFRHIMKVEMEGMVFEDLNHRMIDNITVFRGLNHLDESLTKGKGVVLALVHFGWHMHTIPALGYMGYKINQIADARPVDLEIDRDFFHRRVIEKRLENAANLPVTFIRAGSYLRPLIRTLEKNEILIVALDGREAKTFKPYSLLNRRIMLSPVMLRVAERVGSPILPMFTYRGEDGRHRVIIHPPLRPNDPDQMVKEFLHIFEGYFREKPYQYAQYLLFNALRARGRAEEEFSPLVS